MQNNDVDVHAEENAKKEALKKASGVTCRLCKGGHFTAKCPYKDSLSGLEGAGQLNTSSHLSIFSKQSGMADTGAGLDDDLPPMGDSNGTGAGLVGPSAGASGGSKYVPPSMRAGARGPGESMSRPGGGASRDDLPTLRVTNISEDTEESDLRELFGGFGRVARVYVGRDRETGAGKGFAFVSFEDRASAQKAIDRVHGKGYDNLILSVQWSRKFRSRIFYYHFNISVYRTSAREQIMLAQLFVYLNHNLGL